jgi:RNA polymerase sigma factor (sigma-70 family)
VTRPDTSTSAFDERLLRELTPQVVGAITRRFGDFSAAEDAVQEALIAAARQWPREGVPDNPRGWLIQVAARRMTDHIRSESARRRREASSAPADEASVPSVDQIMPGDHDDTLTLLFMCCHPALTRPSAIALTLRAVGGLTTAEIARAYFVPESTMAQRISRAKQSIRSSDIPFSLPSESDRAARLDAVVHILYLIFNEGYASTSGTDLHRGDLSTEAIRLARALHHLVPDAGEVAGLLALMILTDARRRARTDADGGLVPLDEQDRRLWDQDQIREGVALVTQALARGSVGPYQLQAAIAAIHDEAARADETDWRQIAALYALLQRIADNPMVTLNHAIAVAMIDGPTPGLSMIDALDSDPRIAGHFRLDAVRGHLHERAGNRDRAIAHFRAAAEKTTSIPERNFLMKKAAVLATRGS